MRRCAKPWERQSTVKTTDGIASTFHRLPSYKASRFERLPFKFIRFSENSYLLINLAGEHIVLPLDTFQQVFDGSLDNNSSAYSDLKARHFIYDGDPSLALELLATKYRTKQAGLKEFTGLHIFVTTLRCDHSCAYCQVSRVSEDRAAYDMSRETAEKAIDLMFRSPSKALKVEFQGGESLLNFEIVRFIVERVSQMSSGRDVQFVIATNLAFLTPDIIEFAAHHQIKFSCSLDGPPDLHNRNRPRPMHDSHERTVQGIKQIREALGYDAVSALMTTTMASLDSPEQIIDEYLSHGFNSIFLRWISPFGFAVKASHRIGYETERFLEFYKAGLNYILQLNLQGKPLREEYAAVILRKILTPYHSGYVDLQSPAGMGLSVMVYNYDGDVYSTDEGRMLAEMGDHSFRLGNVHKNTYRELFFDSGVLETALDTQVEGLPGCSDCAYSPYCGTDPVFNHATQNDVIGHRPTSAFCHRNMEIFRYLIEILEANDQRSQILRSWAA